MDNTTINSPLCFVQFVIAPWLNIQMSYSAKQVTKKDERANKKIQIISEA